MDNIQRRNVPRKQTTEKRSIIWQGILEWREKTENTLDNLTLTRQVPCQVSVNMKDGEPELKADSWPHTLIMQLIPMRLIENVGRTYVKNSKSVLFHPSSCEALDSLIKVSSVDVAGFVYLTSILEADNCENKILILTYVPRKQAHLGFIPIDQKGFVKRIIKVIQDDRTTKPRIRQNKHQEYFNFTKEFESLNSLNQQLHELVNDKPHVLQQCTVKPRLTKEERSTLKDAGIAHHEGRYKTALAHYKKYLQFCASNNNEPSQLEVMSRYMVSKCLMQSEELKDLLEAEKVLLELEESVGKMYPMIYYALAKIYIMLCYSKEAERSIQKGFCVLKEQAILLDCHVPERDELILESTRSILESDLQTFLDRCSHLDVPDAKCFMDNCDKISATGKNIFFSSPAFNGMIEIFCNNIYPCTISFHIPCWRAKKIEFSSGSKISDKDMLNRNCFTPNCGNEDVPSVIKKIIVFAEDRSIKSQVELPIEKTPKPKLQPPISTSKGAIKKRKVKRTTTPKPLKIKRPEVGGSGNPEGDLQLDLGEKGEITKPISIELPKDSVLKEKRVSRAEVQTNFRMENNVVEKFDFRTLNPLLTRREQPIESYENVGGAVAESSVDTSDIEQYKSFIYSMIYHNLSETGPVKTSELIGKWKQALEIAGYGDGILKDYTDISEIKNFLLGSKTMVEYGEYICHTSNLAEAIAMSESYPSGSRDRGIFFFEENFELKETTEGTADEINHITKEDDGIAEIEEEDFEEESTIGNSSKENITESDEFESTERSADDEEEDLKVINQRISRNEILKSFNKPPKIINNSLMNYTTKCKTPTFEDMFGTLEFYDEKMKGMEYELEKTVDKMSDSEFKGIESEQEENETHEVVSGGSLIFDEPVNDEEEKETKSKPEQTVADTSESQFKEIKKEHEENLKEYFSKHVQPSLDDKSISEKNRSEFYESKLDKLREQLENTKVELAVTKYQLSQSKRKILEKSLEGQYLVNKTFVACKLETYEKEFAIVSKIQETLINNIKKVLDVDWREWTETIEKLKNIPAELDKERSKLQELIALPENCDELHEVCLNVLDIPSLPQRDVPQMIHTAFEMFKNHCKQEAELIKQNAARTQFQMTPGAQMPPVAPGWHGPNSMPYLSAFYPATSPLFLNGMINDPNAQQQQFWMNCPGVKIPPIIQAGVAKPPNMGLAGQTLINLQAPVRMNENQSAQFPGGINTPGMYGASPFGFPGPINPSCALSSGTLSATTLPINKLQVADPIINEGTTEKDVGFQSEPSKNSGHPAVVDKSKPPLPPPGYLGSKSKARIIDPATGKELNLQDNLFQPTIPRNSEEDLAENSDASTQSQSVSEGSVSWRSSAPSLGLLAKQSTSNHVATASAILATDTSTKLSSKKTSNVPPEVIAKESTSNFAKGSVFEKICGKNRDVSPNLRAKQATPSKANSDITGFYSPKKPLVRRQLIPDSKPVVKTAAEFSMDYRTKTPSTSSVNDDFIPPGFSLNSPMSRRYEIENINQITFDKVTPMGRTSSPFNSKPSESSAQSANIFPQVKKSMDFLKDNYKLQPSTSSSTISNDERGDSKNSSQVGINKILNASISSSSSSCNTKKGKKSMKQSSSASDRIIKALRNKHPEVLEYDLYWSFQAVRKKFNNSLEGISLSRIFSETNRTIMERQRLQLQDYLSYPLVPEKPNSWFSNSPITKRHKTIMNPWVKPKEAEWKKETECVICMDPILNTANGSRCELVPCRHIFHKECIEKWFANQNRNTEDGKNTCPSCRKPSSMDSEFPPLS